MPLAEEAGSSAQIGEWVLRTALEEAAHWPDHVRVAVNLSPLQFNDPTITEIVGSHLKETGVRADRLELEITEGVFLAEGDSTDETFAKLKALGVRLALDDFGTGYSSLGYLKKAPFDKIKIDQSFVRGAASSDQPQRGDHPRHRHPCRDAWHGHLRRGRRDSRRSAAHPRARSQHGPGLYLRPARRRGDGAGARQQGHGRGRRIPMHSRAAAPADAPGDHRINGETLEVKVSNISSMGALVECPVPVSPGGARHRHRRRRPGARRWSAGRRPACSESSSTSLSTSRRLAPKKDKQNDVTMLRPWYVDSAQAS